MFQAQEPTAALCGFAGCVGQPGCAGWQTEDPPSQLHSGPQLIWDAQQLLLDHKTVLLFIFIVVSINELRHQFGFTINHGQESGCCWFCAAGKVTVPSCAWQEPNWHLLGLPVPLLAHQGHSVLPGAHLSLSAHCSVVMRLPNHRMHFSDE